jgi:hypothetical protein
VNYQAGAELVHEEIILVSKAIQHSKFQQLLLTNICKFDVHYTILILLMEMFVGILTGVPKPTSRHLENQGTARQEPGSDYHHGGPPSSI